VLGESTLVLAAASSIANGSPSSREQISRIAGAFSAVIAKSGQTAAARCTNNSMAEFCPSGITGNSCSP
jgi:hypothetical protein